MDTLIADVAQYLLFVILLAGAVCWFLLSRKDKVGLAFQGLVSLVLMVLLIKLAAAIHTDPRPFAVDRSITPLFPHSADNGFPSDHTALAATVSLLVMRYRRWLGVALLVASIVVGAARIAAHVHHSQDIVAGFVIAALAVGIATVIWQWAQPRLPGRLTEPSAK